MYKRLLVVATLMLSFSLLNAAAQEAAVSEQDSSRPDKQEIIRWMNKTIRMPEKQQNDNLNVVLKSVSEPESRTPRSDFLFCTGMAYLGNAGAQKCVAQAYEKGRGIVEDLTESYVWFALALHNKAEGAEADFERVKSRLVSTYPAPTDEELEELVAAQKSKIAEYQTEARKNKK